MAIGRRTISLINRSSRDRDCCLQLPKNIKPSLEMPVDLKVVSLEEGILLTITPVLHLQSWATHYDHTGTTLSQGIPLLLMAIAFVLSIPIVVLGVECCASLLPRSKPLQALPTRPQIDVLVPAHNEAIDLAATLETVLPQLVDGDRLIVIADNCDDETAEIARAIGAEVTERIDPERRGKGYALAHGLQFIAPDPPEVVVLVDADCRVHPGTIDHIACLAIATQRPTQALYLLTQSSHPQPKEAVSALAFLVKNLVRPRGLDRLGLPCLLTGTGMAFPWSVINQASLDNGNLVEDMQFALDLAILGYPPKFCPDGQVTGQLPHQQQATRSQRTRWEHGHLQTLLTQVPRLLQEAIRQRRLDLLALSLHLSVPPLSLLILLWGTVTVLASLAGVLGISWLPARLLAIEGLLIVGSILAAWIRFGRGRLPIQSLLAVPLYILWKIPLYLAFLVRPQTRWIRTERDVVDLLEK
jgi:cellulose synthase/poly-beta-1,6-N-acetylglucosamine synthase-like glycosyltransferase